MDGIPSFTQELSTACGVFINNLMPPAGALLLLHFSNEG